MDKIMAVKIEFENGCFVYYNFNLDYSDQIHHLFALNRYLHLSLEEHKPPFKKLEEAD